MEKIYIYERLRKVLDERVALEIAGAIEEAVGFYEKMVTKDEFNELKTVVNELAEVQKRTEEELRTLVKEHKRTREILMGLSDTIGYGLEDKVIPYIKEFAKIEYGIEVEVLDRRNIIYPDGRFDEVNIYAEGKRDGERVYLIGECKSRPSKKDIDKLLMKAKRVEDYLKSKVEVFLIGYYYSPNVELYLKEKSDKIRYFKSFDFGFKYK